MSIGYERTPGLRGVVKGTAFNLLGPEFYGKLRQAKDGVKERLTYPRMVYYEVNGIKCVIQASCKFEKDQVTGQLFEKEYLEYMTRFIKRDSIICDVGSAVGIHAIPLAKSADWGIVYSFEPEPSIAVAQRRNLELNGVRNVDLFEIALGESDCQINLCTSGRSGNAPHIMSNNVFSDVKHRATIPAMSYKLSTLLKHGVIDPPSVLKIDVEGAGIGVLNGLGYLQPDNIFMEIHPGRGEELDQVTCLLTSRGYTRLMYTQRGGESHTHFQLAVLMSI